jgi:DNA-binding beta-propeller fold protein YncE
MALLACQGNSARPDASTAAAEPEILAVGPQLVSNQTTTPLRVLGHHLSTPMQLHLGAPANLDIPLHIIDSMHASAMLPPFELGTFDDVQLALTLRGGRGSASLTAVNDRGYSEFHRAILSSDFEAAIVADTHSDILRVTNVKSKVISLVPTADGPSALVAFRSPDKKPRVAVSHLFSPVIWIFEDEFQKHLELPGALQTTGLAASPAGDVLFVAETVSNSVFAVSLSTQRELWRTQVHPNPRELLVARDSLFVGSLQAGTIQVLNLKTGHIGSTLEVKKNTAIWGGHTQAQALNVMGGKAVRGLAYSAKLNHLFVASIGPNIGPNAQRMEVSPNAGVGVVDPVRGFQHHLGFGAGVTDQLLLDDANGLLYATDVSLGLVRVLDAKALVNNPQTALLQEIFLEIPAWMPRIREASDFSVTGRASVSLHAGPSSLMLAKDAKTLWVMNRFTRTYAVLDVSRAKQKQSRFVEQFAFADVPNSQRRVQGEVSYYADLGRTGMSCDACHLDGHTEGVFFEKTHPMRIYRSTTVRGSRHTSPYFTPASTRSLAETCDLVGSRNRFQNPKMSAQEIDALALYTSLIPTPPNPKVLPDGRWPSSVTLPDGTSGSPVKGLTLFEGKAQCGTCHPFPEMTTDNARGPRGQYLDVGTPHVLPLKPQFQDATFRGFAPPSLEGVWDVFPLMTTGTAGLLVGADDMLHVDEGFALKRAVTQWAPTHGRADLLEAQEVSDLLAFILML